MKYFNLIFLLLFLISETNAQSITGFPESETKKNDSKIFSSSDYMSRLNLPVDTAKKVVSKWNNDLTARLNLTQIGFSNWVKGGENSFAWNSIVDGKFFYKDSLIDWRTSNRFSYGETKQGSKAFRKNDDLLDLSSVLSFIVGWSVDPYFSLTLRSQFTKGYTYKEDTATAISNFFDPGYTSQNMGFQYAPKMKDIVFSIRAGFSVKETYTKDFNTITDDPKTLEIEKVKVQLGSELVTDYQQKFNSLLSIKSKLEYFTNYNRWDESTIRWDNLVTIQLIKYIAVSFNTVMYYNKDESSQFQWKEILGIGLFYDFI
jgi:hypothetical protein